jgi:hypothetical protein
MRGELLTNSSRPVEKLSMTTTSLSRATSASTM